MWGGRPCRIIYPKIRRNENETTISGQGTAQQRIHRPDHLHFLSDGSLEELDICLTFDKQHYDSPAQVPVEELAGYCRQRYDTTAYENMSREQLAALFMRETKTEIHICASLNDVFIGCIHKQLTCRHMHFSPEDLSEGCIMPGRLEGVLKVTVLAFQVLMDDTPYTVTVSGKKPQKTEKRGDSRRKQPPTRKQI